MSVLAAAFREKMKATKNPAMYEEATTHVAYPTGIPELDHRNGCITKIQQPDGSIKQYKLVGIMDGSLNTMIGLTGSGKTTAAIQIAANIVKDFPDSAILHEDIEGGSNNERILELTGWSREQFLAKYIRRDKGIFAESFFSRVKTHCDLKKENRDALIYDTGYLDERGNPIIKYIPSVVILDSLALLMPEKYAEEEEMSGQMSATAAAKANASVFKRLIPSMKDTNTILFVINHINENVDIGVVKKKKQMNYLKQSETLPGGRAPIYLANNVFKFEHAGNLDFDELYKINGFYSTITIVKSRTNMAGQTMKLVFNQQTGFDPLLSTLEMLKDAKAIKGAGVGMFFEGLDIKFSNSNFKTKYVNEPTFKAKFWEVATEVLNGQLINYGEFKEISNAEVMASLEQMGLYDASSETAEEKALAEVA